MEQGSPIPRSWTGLWTVTNQIAQQEVSDWQAKEASSVFIATLYLFASPVISLVTLDSPKSLNPIRIAACEGSRLHAP